MSHGTCKIEWHSRPILVALAREILHDDGVQFVIASAIRQHSPLPGSRSTDERAHVAVFRYGKTALELSICVLVDCDSIDRAAPVSFARGVIDLDSVRVVHCYLDIC